MADVRDIYRFMDRIAPFRTQEDFDNAGFLVGRGDREVNRILYLIHISEPTRLLSNSYSIFK